MVDLVSEIENRERFIDPAHGPSYSLRNCELVRPGEVSMPPNPLPEPQYPLLARKEYKVTSETVISLCVVRTKIGPDLRLYKWRNFHHVGDWRVAHANLSIRDVNLEQLARDAREMASRYGAALNWDNTTTQGEGAEGDLDPPEAGHTPPERKFLELLRELFGERIPSDEELRQKAEELRRQAAISRFLADRIRSGEDFDPEDIPF